MASPSAWASRLERSISGTGRPIGRLTSPHGAMSMTPIPTCPSTCRRRISRNGRTSWRAVGGGARVGGGSSAAGRPLSTGGLVAITSRWLLLALVLDLSITRLSLRIAIFLPKGAVGAAVLLAVPAVRAAARDPYAVAIVALAVAASLPALAALGGAAAAATDAAGAPGLGLGLPTVGGGGFLLGGVLAA